MLFDSPRGGVYFENSPAPGVQSSDSGYGSDDGDDDVGGPAVIAVNASDGAGDELAVRPQAAGVIVVVLATIAVGNSPGGSYAYS